MDRIQELLSRLADLADADVAELEGLILSEFDSAEAEEPSSETVERMVSLADALDEVRGEVRRRNELAAALTEKAAAAAERVRGAANETSVKDEEEQVAEDARAVADEAEAIVEEEEEDEDEEKVPAVYAAETEELSSEEPAEAELASEEPASEAETETAEEPQAELATEDEAEPTTELSEDAPSEAETPTETTELSADAPAVEETPQEDAVTASSNDGSGVVVTPPASAAPVPSVDQSRSLSMTITAGADIPGYGTGAALDTMETVADAFAKRLHTLRNVQGGDGAQHTIATLSFEFPEDRILAGDDPSNITKVNKVVSPQALTAAAGICAPLETIYDVNVCGDDDRPVRDALARFNADRGGVRIFGSPTLGADCVGIWNPTGADSATGGPAGAPARPGGYKTCCDADCPGHQDIGLEAVYACVKFSNYTNRFFPEVVKANTDLALINHARAAELNLLFKIAAASTAIDATAGLANTGKAGDKAGPGTARAVIAVILNAAATLRRKHRLSVNAPLRALIPDWVLDAMAADLAQQMPGDGLESLVVSESRINALFRERGVNVTWTLDAVNKAGNGNVSTPQASPSGFDAEASFALFPEGTFLFLDGGTLDLGVQRDATMLSTNEYATFVETFEGIAMTGCESLWITTEVCANGAAAALIDNACA